MFYSMLAPVCTYVINAHETGVRGSAVRGEEARSCGKKIDWVGKELSFSFTQLVSLAPM